MSSSRVNHSCPKEIVHAISHYYYTYLPMIFPNNQYFHRQTTCQNGSLGYRYICFGFRQFKTRYLKFIEFAEKENVVKFSTITPRNIVQNQVAISGCPTVDLLNHLSKVFIISQAQLGGALAPPWLLGGELSPAPPLVAPLHNIMAKRFNKPEKNVLNVRPPSRAPPIQHKITTVMDKKKGF